MKKSWLKKYIGPIIILFIVSYGLLFYKLFFMNSVQCKLEWTEEEYQRKEVIELKYKKQYIQKIIYNETFTTNNENILNLKKDEYIKNQYKVRTYKTKLKSTKVEKGQKNYADVIKILTKEGYHCQ